MGAYTFILFIFWFHNRGTYLQKCLMETLLTVPSSKLIFLTVTNELYPIPADFERDVRYSLHWLPLSYRGRQCWLFYSLWHPNHTCKHQPGFISTNATMCGQAASSLLVIHRMTGMLFPTTFWCWTETCHFTNRCIVWTLGSCLLWLTPVFFFIHIHIKCVMIQSLQIIVISPWISA